MKLICLDLEGVLVPEIWVAFAEASRIPELKKTTRDEPDYDKLMRWRLSVLKEHGLGLKEIQETKQGNQRKELHPGEKPEVCFALCEGDEVEAIYAYCNLHSLWIA